MDPTPEPRGAGGLRRVLAAVAAAALVVGLAVAAAAVLDRDLSDLTRDTTSAAGASFYLGYVSNLGVIVWWGAAVACALAGVLMRRRGDPDAGPLLAAAGVTGLLALDDLFQVHEELLPALHVPQLVVVAAYGAIVLGAGWRHRGFLARQGWAPLGVALVLLGTSAATDIAEAALEADLELLEDGSKLLGIAAWSAHFGAVAVRAADPGEPDAVQAASVDV